MRPKFNSLVSLLLFAATILVPLSTYSQDSGLGDDSTPVVTVQARFSVNGGGRSGELSVTATVRNGYHIYAMSQPKPFLATRIVVDPSSEIEFLSPFQPSRRPHVQRHESIDVELHEYEGDVTWSAPFKILGSVDPGDLVMTGQVSAQACYDQGCLPPKEYVFAAEYKSSPVSQSVATLESTKAANANEQPDAAASSSPGTRLDFNKLEAEGSSTASLPLYVVLPMALAAGFILNFMPCVLPVIGLKVMAFAQQAGDSRGRVFMLNLWYSLGLISVFLVLATLAAFLGMGWGQQFSSVTFNIVLAAVVFVFGLSFLGVWEIPIPGFVGAGAANDLAQREGAAGAFSKGVLTTVLATPCSGPLLGSALTWAVTQSPLLTYLVFAFVGLGMASPYLVVGAFPKLIAFLPKPGEWMNTFKHVMGFVLLATVAYLLSFMSIPYVVPTVTFMIGLGAACWWIGRLSITASQTQKTTNWIQAIAVTSLVGYISFGWLPGIMNERFERAVDRAIVSRNVSLNLAVTPEKRDSNELPWQPYSNALLTQYTAAGKTVFVDFTADWCLTCKANEAAAINKEATKQLVEANDVITLRADKTQPAPEVDELLQRLGNKAGSIPFYAVFPAGNPNKPILLDGMFTSPQPILDALEKAGPSRQPDAPQATASL